MTEIVVDQATQLKKTAKPRDPIFVKPTKLRGARVDRLAGIDEH